MKFLHISDLHLGKRLNEFSLIEDQKYILNQILNIAEREEADGIIIAGDVYDRPVPSSEAVQVFDSFLTGLAARGKRVFVISGNHDSAERLAFGARLMSGQGVYVSPVYKGEASKIRLKDEYGEIFIHLLPFVKPAVVRYALKREELPETYQEAAALVMERMKVDKEARNILVAHQFVTGAGRCESEEITVGGLDNIDAELFDDFDYVALGHIHSPQWIKRETVRYCGTPLKYSFSEAEQEKSVTLVELREKGRVAIRLVPLEGLRDMGKIRGSYEEVMARDFYQGKSREDYVQITLTDEEDIPDGFGKLRTVYPNLTRLLYDNSRTRNSKIVETVREMEKKSELELFEEFYEIQNDRPMSGTQKDFVRRLINDLREQRQERGYL